MGPGFTIVWPFYVAILISPYHGDLEKARVMLRGVNDKLYHNEVEEPRAWTMAVTYIASCQKRMRKYEDSMGNNHKIVRLAWRQRHIFIVNSNNREGLH